MGNLNVQNLDQHGPLLSTIKKVVLYSCCHHSRPFKAFSKYQKLFESFLMQAPCFLRSAILLVCHSHRMHSAQTHLNVTCTKMQHIVAVALATHTHNKSTWWYVVAHSCIIHSKHFIQSVWKILSHHVCSCRTCWLFLA